MRYPKAQVVRLLRKAIERLGRVAVECYHSENPQVLNTAIRAKEAALAYQTVLDALEGVGICGLKIAAGE